MSDLTQEQSDALQKYTNQALQLVGNVQTGCCVRYYPAKETAQQQEQTVKLLCSLLPLDSKDVQKRVKKTLGRYAEVPLERKIPLEAGKAIMAELKKRKIYGVRCVDSAKREYPRGAMFSNMLGVLDVDGRGVSGIESLMNKYLTPEDGYITFFRDSRGRPVDIDDVVVTPPQNGADIYLTIEEPLQLMVEEELAKMTAERTPAHAYAMMIDPTTGAIMALAQYPTFDPNNRQELLDPGATSNHILVQSYDPGSIMKCLSIAAAMERHYTDLDQVIYCEHGSYFFGGKTLHDDNHHFDNLTVAEVIQKSSNIGTAKIATEKMDDATTYECLNSYLFGKPTGLGFYPEGQNPIVFPSESKGKFRSLRNWDKLTASRMVIGQGISTSILQIAQAWCALANGGVIMQPHIIDRMVMPDGQVIHNIPREKGRPLSASTVEDIRRALVMVTHTGGTGTKAAVAGYEVAGKTGTGQQWIPADPVAGTKGAYSNKYCLASFIGFVPANNPRFLLIVSSEGAKGYPRTGGYVSAPVFSRIAARALDYLQVPPTDEEAYLAAKEKEERNLAEQMLKEQKSQRKNASNNKKKDNRTARR